MFYLQHPSNVLHIVDMLVHIQITPLGLKIRNQDSCYLLVYVYGALSCSICFWSLVAKFTFKFEFTYFALLSNFEIFSGTSSWIACFSITQGEISALTSSGIFERRLLFSFIITQVLFEIEVVSTVRSS